MHLWLEVLMRSSTMIEGVSVARFLCWCHSGLLGLFNIPICVSFWYLDWRILQVLQTLSNMLSDKMHTSHRQCLLILLATYIQQWYLSPLCFWVLFFGVGEVGHNLDGLITLCCNASIFFFTLIFFALFMVMLSLNDSWASKRVSFWWGM